MFSGETRRCHGTWQHGDRLFLSGYPTQRVPSHHFTWPSRHQRTQWTLMPQDSCHVPTRRGTANLLTQADCYWYAEPDIPGNWQPPSAAAAAAAQSGTSTTAQWRTTLVLTCSAGLHYCLVFLSFVFLATVTSQLKEIHNVCLVFKLLGNWNQGVCVFSHVQLFFFYFMPPNVQHVQFWGREFTNKKCDV